jgi:hypothetical protein
MRNKKFVVYIGKRSVPCDSIQATIECLKTEIENGNTISDIQSGDSLGGKVVSAVDVLELLKKAKIRLCLDKENSN